MPSSLTPHHPGHFDDDLIYRDQLPFGKDLLVQRSQTINNLLGNGTRFDDSFRPFAYLRQIGRVALKPSQRCLGMSGCDRNGLCEFMRDGGDHFSHRADPVRMGKIGLELFGLFAVFDVGPGHKPKRNLSLLIVQRIVTDQKPAIRSVVSP
jgi:hypothetical protein